MQTSGIRDTGGRMSRRNWQRHQLQAPGQIPRRRMMHSDWWALSTDGCIRSGEDHAPGCAIRRWGEGGRGRVGTRDRGACKRRTDEIRIQREKKHTFHAYVRVFFSSRRQRVRDVRGETITLTFFEMAVECSSTNVLFLSRLAPASLPRDGFPRERKGSSHKARRMRETITRDDYRRHRRAQKKCIRNSAARGSRDAHCACVSFIYAHVWRTREGTLAYRRYNTFVSRGDIPQTTKIRSMRARGVDWSSATTRVASTWPRASTPTIPSTPHCTTGHHRLPQTSLLRIMQNVIIDKYLNYISLISRTYSYRIVKVKNVLKNFESSSEISCNVWFFVIVSTIFTTIKSSSL